MDDLEIECNEKIINLKKNKYLFLTKQKNTKHFNNDP